MQTLDLLAGGCQFLASFERGFLICLNFAACLGKLCFEVADFGVLKIPLLIYVGDFRLILLADLIEVYRQQGMSVE